MARRHSERQRRIRTHGEKNHKASSEANVKDLLPWEGKPQDVILNGRRRRAVGFSSVLRGEAHFQNCG